MTYARAMRSFCEFSLGGSRRLRRRPDRIPAELALVRFDGSPRGTGAWFTQRLTVLAGTASRSATSSILSVAIYRSTSARRSAADRLRKMR